MRTGDATAAQFRLYGAWIAAYHALMEGSFADSAAQVVRERVNAIPVPARYCYPEVLVEDGYGFRITPSTPERPKPILTVGERLALEASREIMQGIAAITIAQADLATPERRAAEQAGSWAPGALKFGAVLLLLGLLFGGTWFTFAGGLVLMAGIAGMRSKMAGSAAYRQRVYDADELAADWVGRQSVVDALRWLQQRHGREPEPGDIRKHFDPPQIRDRLRRLGA